MPSPRATRHRSHGTGTVPRRLPPALPITWPAEPHRRCPPTPRQRSEPSSPAAHYPDVDSQPGRVLETGLRAGEPCRRSTHPSATLWCPPRPLHRLHHPAGTRRHGRGAVCSFPQARATVMGQKGLAATAQRPQGSMTLHVMPAHRDTGHCAPRREPGQSGSHPMVFFPFVLPTPAQPDDPPGCSSAAKGLSDSDWEQRQLQGPPS